MGAVGFDMRRVLFNVKSVEPGERCCCPLDFVGEVGIYFIADLVEDLSMIHSHSKIVNLAEEKDILSIKVSPVDARFVACRLEADFSEDRVDVDRPV